MEPREDKIPVVQIVQLVEHCAGVTEVDNVRIPVQAFLASAKVGPKELRGSYIHFNPHVQFRYTEQYSKCFFFFFIIYAVAK